MNKLLIAIIFLAGSYVYAQAPVPLQHAGRLAICNLNGYTIDVETCYQGATAGDKLIAALADTTVPVGVEFSMEGIVNEATQPVSGGTGIIEVGGRGFPQHVKWPDCIGPTNTYCGMILHTASATLPTPTTSVSGVSTGGSLPADTYHITTNWNTGNAPGAVSTEQTVTTTGTTSSFSFIPPTTCPQYSVELQINISNTAMGGSGAETWQASMSCNAAATPFIVGGPLFPHSQAQPTGALPLPSIIIHNNKSTFYAPFTGQDGFPFYTVSGLAATDMIATTDNGYSGIAHLYFSNNGGSTALACGMYDRGAYIQSTRDHIAIYPGAVAANALCIGGQYNDVTWKDVNLACGTGVTSPLTINWTPETGTTNGNQGGDTEGIHGVIFDGGLINTKGCAATGPSFAITGRSGATASGLSGWLNNTGGIDGVEFRGTRLELNAQGGVITDAQNITFSNIYGISYASGVSFLTINQTYTPTAQLYGVGGIDVVNAEISGWTTNAVLNNASTNAEDTATTGGSSNIWRGPYYFGGTTYSLTAGSPNDSQVVANHPTRYGRSSPVTMWSHLNLQQATPPVATTCGGGTAAGTDQAFKVTGITTATACTITFNKPITQGVCVAQSQLSTLGVGTTTAGTSTYIFNIGATVTSFSAICY